MPADPAPDPATLRRRAADLRRLAVAVDHSIVRNLGALAGSDTWVGPTASAFLDTWRWAGRLLDEAIDDLHRQARRLDAAAAELERVGAG